MSPLKAVAVVSIASVLLAFTVSARALTRNTETSACVSPVSEIAASRLAKAKGYPSENDWRATDAVTFCSDWKGSQQDAERATQVRLIWSPRMLFVRFIVHYRELYTYAPSNARMNKMWQRDVAEMFIQSPTDAPHSYKEFEISPNGNWIDLSIGTGISTELHCSLTTHAVIDSNKKIWTGDVAIPMPCLTANFDPRSPWRVNFFRIEGRDPDRFYSAWRPTNTAQPNFHVPEAFGTLRFK